MVKVPAQGVEMKYLIHSKNDCNRWVLTVQYKGEKRINRGETI